MILKGDLRRDKNRIVDWGSAFVVKDFFIKLGCFKGLIDEEIKERIRLLEKKQVPADFLVKAIKKKICILDYVKGISEEGKLKYSTWNIVDVDPEQLRNAFKKSVAKGFPLNYKPDLMDNAIDKNEAVVSAPSDDDFPF